MSSRPRTIVTGVSVILAACAGSAGIQHPLHPDGDVITSDELATVLGTTQNAYSAVERLRPLFLASRPGSGTIHNTSPHLYVLINGNFVGDVDALKTIPLASIASIRRVQATTAFTQLGEIRAGDGVIEVRLRQ
jgi:hypothetical protein